LLLVEKVLLLFEEHNEFVLGERILLKHKLLESG